MLFFDGIFPAFSCARIEPISSQTSGFLTFAGGIEMRYWPEILVQVFKIGPGKIYGRQPLSNFAWSILQYLDPYVNVGIYGL